MVIPAFTLTPANDIATRSITIRTNPEGNLLLYFDEPGRKNGLVPGTFHLTGQGRAVWLITRYLPQTGKQAVERTGAGLKLQTGDEVNHWPVSSVTAVGRWDMMKVE